jgi:hypothetical protein
VKAAGAPGMSYAVSCQKIREYGILAPAAV